MDAAKETIESTAGEFRERYFRIGSSMIHAITAGPASGDPVVLVHGFPDYARTWRHQLPFLGKNGKYAVAIDLRGAGGSSCPAEPESYDADRLADDLVGVLDRLNSRKVIAHDFGGHVAWLVAMRGTLDRLVALNAVHPAHARAFAAVPSRMMRVGHAMFFQPPGLAELVLDPGFLVDVLRANSRPESLSAEERECYREAFKPMRRRRAMFEWYRRLALSTLTRKKGMASDETRLAAVDTDVLTIFGRGDPFLDRKMVEPPPSWVRGRRRLLDSRAGHWAHWDDADGCNEAILDFLR